MKLVTFDTAYAKLGNWPGRVGYQEGRLLFNLVSGLKAGDAATVIGAGFGRAVMLVGTAARNVGAKVYAIEAWSSLDPSFLHWFNKSVWLTGLTEIVTPIDPINPTFEEFADMALVFFADEAGRTVDAAKFLGSLSPGSVAFDPYGSMSSNGLQPVPGIPGAWRKDEKVEEKEAEKTAGEMADVLDRGDDGEEPQVVGGPGPDSDIEKV